MPDFEGNGYYLTGKNGRNRRVFTKAMVDTGATHSYVTPSFARILGFEINEIEPFTVEGTDIFSVNSYTIADLFLGDILFSIKLYIHDTQSETGCQIILGEDFQKEYITGIDIEADEIRIKRSEKRYKAPLLGFDSMEVTRWEEMSLEGIKTKVSLLCDEPNTKLEMDITLYDDGRYIRNHIERKEIQPPIRERTGPMDFAAIISEIRPSLVVV